MQTENRRLLEKILAVAMLLGFGAHVFFSAILPEARVLFAPRTTLTTAPPAEAPTPAAAPSVARAPDPAAPEPCERQPAGSDAIGIWNAGTEQWVERRELDRALAAGARLRAHDGDVEVLTKESVRCLYRESRLVDELLNDAMLEQLASDQQRAAILQAQASQASKDDGEPITGTRAGAAANGGAPLGSGGSVHVRGYTRSDGTHGAPYTRTAPGPGRR